jgi:hypothetical protein
MSNTQGKITKMLEQAPLGKMIESMANALVDAQSGLTMKTVEAIEKLSQQKVKLPNDTQEYSLLTLGLIPSFMHFSEATISAKLVFSCSESEETSLNAQAGGSVGAFSASVNAGYSNKYSFSAEGASELNARIISVPPPDILLERLQRSNQPPATPTPAEQTP